MFEISCHDLGYREVKRIADFLIKMADQGTPNLYDMIAEANVIKFSYDLYRDDIVIYCYYDNHYEIAYPSDFNIVY